MLSPTTGKMVAKKYTEKYTEKYTKKYTERNAVDKLVVVQQEKQHDELTSVGRLELHLPPATDGMLSIVMMIAEKYS